MTYDPTNEGEAVGRNLSVEKLEQLQSTYSISNRNIGELSEGKLASLLRKLTLGDRPRLRAKYQGLFEQSEEGKATTGVKLRALQQLDASRSNVAPGTIAGVPCGPVEKPGDLSPPPLTRGAGLAPTGVGWQSLGPGRVGGRTRSIVVDPNHADRIWLGSVGGGIWLTTDGGTHWQPVDDRMANLAVTSIVMDPTNSNVMYAGTGEGFHNVDAIRGAGIFRTINGAAWDVLAQTNTSDFQWINRLAISADGSTLLAATRTGIHRSTDGNRAVWTLAHAGNVADVRFHPTNSNLGVAGGAGNAGGALFTTDGGQTWNAASGITGSGRVELTYAAADPNHIVYASVDHNRGRIFRSADGGATYTMRATNNDNGFAAQYLGQQGWYDNTIWAGDLDSDFVIVGGIDLWRSTDGGDSLARISNWTEGASAHADHHAIVESSSFDGANRTVFFGNDGGIYRADDVHSVGNDANQTSGWINLVNGYAVTQFYGAAGNATTGTIVGGAQDNGTLALQPGAGANAWTEILGGDGGYCGADPADPNFFYGEYVNLDIHRNDNGATGAGQWWLNYISGSFYNSQISNWDRKPSPFRIPDAGTNDSLFIAPFVVDPGDGDRILAGGASLWQTTDAKTANTNTSGPSWASIKPRVGGGGQPNLISAVTIAAGNPDLVWVGHVRGDLFWSGNATNTNPTWNAVGGALPNRMCTRLVLDRSDNDRVYATFAGYSTGNIWRSDNVGANWQDLSATLPQAPIRCIAIHPRRPTFLYLGTELGIFTSENSGATWSPTNEGPTNCAVSDLIWMDETLVCATHGRSMFSIDLSGVPNP